MHSNFIKTLRNSFLPILLAATLLASCTRETSDDDIIPIPTSAQITDTVHYSDLNMTAYNFTYASTDPWGQPVTLSGTITISDELKKSDVAEGLILYNHFTIYRANQCPSAGELSEQAMIVGSRLITISPDYYGFGVTTDKPQAYCLSEANARAAVDALIEGKKLLHNMGFKWKDNIFNIGYSQGGQTAMAVLRLVTEEYPDIHFARTFAGGGSYDLASTYRRFVVIDHSAMPSTVVSVMLAFNHFQELGIPRDSMFVEPLLSHIDEWILSKNYTRQEIDDLVGNNNISTYIAPTMLDTNSNYSHIMMEALESDNICKGWTPRSDESIMLVHHTHDAAVPVENTTNLIAFLQQNGVTNLDIYVDNYGSYFGLPAHETGAMKFISATKEWLCEYLGIESW